MFFELLALIPLILYLIRSVSAEASLKWISRIRFRCSFFRPWENQYMVHGFDSISIVQFPAMIGSVSAEGSLILKILSSFQYRYKLFTLRYLINGGTLVKFSIFFRLPELIRTPRLLIFKEWWSTIFFSVAKWVFSWSTIFFSVAKWVFSFL